MSKILYTYCEVDRVVQEFTERLDAAKKSNQIKQEETLLLRAVREAQRSLHEIEQILTNKKHIENEPIKSHQSPNS